MDHVMVNLGVCFAWGAWLALQPMVGVWYWERDLYYHASLILVLFSTLTLFISNCTYGTCYAYLGTLQYIPHLISIGIFQESHPAVPVLFTL
jgi:hypothetical protein